MAVWYPESLFGPNASVPWWVTGLVVVAFLLGFAVAIWLLRRG